MNKKRPTRIYCVGDDGALSNMIKEIVNTQHEIVVIPLGTGNDFSCMITAIKKTIEVLKQLLQDPVKK